MIKLEGICRSFSGLQVLGGISLEIERGEIVSITGPSGAGKTTLLQIMGTLDKPSSGHVLYDGTNVTAMKQEQLASFRCSHIGFVFQFHQLLPEFTAIENIMIPGLIKGTPAAQASQRAASLLEMLGLSDRAQHKPSQLSGGEKQRIAVARALMNHPDVVLADEPSGSLDSRNRDELHRLFFELREKTGQTFVIVTHDENLACLADRRIRIKDGLVEG